MLSRDSGLTAVQWSALASSLEYLPLSSLLLKKSKSPWIPAPFSFNFIPKNNKIRWNQFASSLQNPPFTQTLCSQIPPAVGMVDWITVEWKQSRLPRCHYCLRWSSDEVSPVRMIVSWSWEFQTGRLLPPQVDYSEVLEYQQDSLLNFLAAPSSQPSLPIPSCFPFVLCVCSWCPLSVPPTRTSPRLLPRLLFVISISLLFTHFLFPLISIYFSFSLFISFHRVLPNFPRKSRVFSKEFPTISEGFSALEVTKCNSFLSILWSFPALFCH